MKISCIIPTCNRPQLLTESLQSILEQSYPAFEILIINNHFSSIELPNLPLYVRIFNLGFPTGASVARNFGASMASGDILAFLDDDDRWDSQYLEKISQKYLKPVPPKMVIGGLYLTQHNHTSIYRHQFNHRSLNEIVEQARHHGVQILLEQLYERNPGCTGSNLTIERKTFYELKGFNPSLMTAEDKSLVIEFIKKCGINALEIQEQAIAHYQTPQNADRLSSRSNRLKGKQTFFRLYKKEMSWNQRYYNLQEIARLKYKTQHYLDFSIYPILTLYWAKEIIKKLGQQART